MDAWIGKPVRRKEDQRLLTGKGSYADDVNLAGQAHACLLRSPHAHAEIRGIDAQAAAAMPGVLAVLTAVDWLADGLGTSPSGAVSPDVIDPSKPGLVPREGTKLVINHALPLARDKVRHIGEGVAFIVAETRHLAEDAAELIDVDYAPLAAVMDAPEAVRPGAPTLWPEMPDNVALEVEWGDGPATDAAFTAAAHVVGMDLRSNRVAPVSLEPRASVVRYDPETERFTVYVGSSRSVMTKEALARALGVDDGQVHIVSGDIGGSYGMRGGGYPENKLCMWAARRLGRPVKWTATRSEALMSDSQARDQVTRGELALDADGKFIGLRIRHHFNLGSRSGVYAPLSNGVRLITSSYDIRAAHLIAQAIVTNTQPISVYRGAGRPEAIFNIERLIDTAADDMGIDRIEMRRLNLIRPDQLPYTNPMGIPYDSGEFEVAMDMTLGLADWAGFAERRKASEARGLKRGIGIANYIQIPTGQLNEWTSVNVSGGGTVEVLIGTDSSGQSHETTFAQVVAEHLGVPFETVTITEGDTDRIPAGGGSHSDRSMRLGGAIMVEAADKVIEKGRQIAAHILEAAPADIAFAGGTFTVTGTDRAVGLFEAAAAAESGDVPEALAGPLAEEADIHRRLPAYPNGAAVCEVEVDPETGAVQIQRYAAVDDPGRAINPLILDGQAHGSITQGIGQALLEDIIYDPETGQLLTGSFMDYGLPRADDLPFFDLAMHEVPAPSNPLGVKGGGEGGTVSALGAVINAVVHALRPLGVTHIPMPATPERVWRAIHKK